MMIKGRSLPVLFLLLLASSTLGGCLLDNPEYQTIKSITVSPDKIKHGSSTGTVTVTVSLDVPLKKVDVEGSYPFVIDASGKQARGRVVNEEKPKQKGDDSLVYTISRSWLADLPIGEHHVGFTLKTDTATMTVNDKTMGNFTIE